jgi:outer membrane protein TolC
VLGVSPLISWRIFDGGRVEAEIRVAEARQQRAVVAYEQAVLAALGDAERALSDYRHALRLRESLARAEAAASAALMATQTRVDAGDLGLLPLLDAERQLWDTRARQAQAEQQAAIGLVVACKALGGGWPADPDDAA